jgi:hypothetical protein
MLWKTLVLALGITALSVSAKTLLVLPVVAESEKASDLAAVNRLFRDAVQARTTDSLLPSPRSATCSERECARALGRNAGADQVVYSSLHRLGSKLIFSATVVTVENGEGFNQRLSAVSIEDMEAVSLRMADALVLRKNTEQVASLDNITAKETDKEPERRRSLYNGGIALGYLFPMGSSFSTGEEGDLHQYSQMIRFTWLNTWEFRNDLALGADVAWSTPNAFGADLNLRYLFGRGDYTPFLGGGIGLHYVGDDKNGDENKRNSGPALNAQGGMMLFRTYDVNVMLRGQYQVIFNSDLDHGPAIDVGVSFRNKDKSPGGGGSSSGGLGMWGYAGLGLLFLMIVGAAN